jgi:hypothetical protein
MSNAASLQFQPEMKCMNNTGVAAVPTWTKRNYVIEAMRHRAEWFRSRIGIAALIPARPGM